MLSSYDYLIAQARNGTLDPSLDAGYFQSPAFKARVSNMSEKDYVSLALFMLKNVSLEPFLAQQNLEDLKRTGVAHLVFFQTGLPGAATKAIAEPSHVFALLKAIRANMESKMFRAALKWKALHKGEGKYRKMMPFYSAMLEAERARDRASLPWKTAQDYAAEKAQNREGQTPLCRQHDFEMAIMLDDLTDIRVRRRIDRIHSIARQTYTPDCKTWHDVMLGLAREVFTPESDPLYNTSVETA